MLVDEDTGEKIGAKFAKLFFSDMKALFNLSGTDISILLRMVESIGLGNVNELSMSPARKKRIARELGLKSHLQVTNSLNKMVRNDVLKKMDPEERFDYRFMVNPNILFSGNDYQRKQVLIDYTNGVRRVRVFNNDEDLDKWYKGRE